jgi:NAD(P)-dependent dehydrogenase (short-subunit alcohol dehydrogenase family)
VAGQIEHLGRRAVCVQMDVTRLDQIESAVGAALSAIGRIDILVNNAGLGPENPAEDVTEADFDFTCAVNLKGTFFVSQAVGRAMIRQGGGTIVNLGSQAGEVALPGEAVYCMTKAGIHHLTRCLAVEWGVHNITVNAVAPTFILTPGTAPALDDPAFRADEESGSRACTEWASRWMSQAPSCSSPARGLVDHGPHHADRRWLDGA